MDPWMTIELARDIKLLGIIDSRYGKSIAARILEADDDHQLVGRRYPPGDERVRSIHRRHALEIDVRLSELRTDIIDVIRHTPEDGVGDRLGGIAARISVAVQLLDPFEIDDGNDTDLEIRVLSDIHLVGHNGPVKTLVEQQIRSVRAEAASP